MGKLDGKVSIVTGAGTGIGNGIARAFAREGSIVVLAARRQEVIDEAAEAIRSEGGSADAISTDVTDEDQVVDLFEKTVAGHGRVDVLINNAGVYETAPLDELSLESWSRTIDTNLTGAFLCSREAMKVMKKRGGGRIINIGSISAKVPRWDASAYTASKFGLTGLTMATALEGRDHDVVASILQPGNVHTDLRDFRADTDAPDLEPGMQPEDIAQAALTMASLPLYANMIESTVLPREQPYLGRG